MLPPFDTLDGLDLLAFAAIGGVVLALRHWFTKPNRMMPEPQHHVRRAIPVFRRREQETRLEQRTDDQRIVWNYPQRPADCRLFDREQLEGRDAVRAWLRGEYTTPFSS